jgi:hypothetical protein
MRGHSSYSDFAGRGKLPMLIDLRVALLFRGNELSAPRGHHFIAGPVLRWHTSTNPHVFPAGAPRIVTRLLIINGGRPRSLIGKTFLEGLFYEIRDRIGGLPLIV